METFRPIDTTQSGVPEFPPVAPEAPSLFAPSDPEVPPFPSASAPPEARRRAPWFVVALIAVAALLGGLLIGAGVIGRSQTADMRDQRDAAIAERDDARDEVDALAGQVADLESEADSAADKVTQCQAAAESTQDLLVALDDEWADFFEYLEADVGSQTEADIMAHLDEQGSELVDQRDATEEALDDCPD